MTHDQADPAAEHEPTESERVEHLLVNRLRREAAEDGELHDSLDELVRLAVVPPLPYEAIVRGGARRRRRRRVLSGLATSAAVLAVAVAGVAWSGLGTTRVTTADLGRPVTPTTLPTEPELRTTMPSGVVNGARWTIHVVDYREKGDGMYCQEWKIVVNGREDPLDNGACQGGGPMGPTDFFEGALPVLRNPARSDSHQFGTLFAGDTAPNGAVMVRVSWAGGSARSAIFRLPGDTRNYYAVALPYDPGRPKADYVVTLSFLGPTGKQVPPRFPASAHQPPWSITDSMGSNIGGMPTGAPTP